MRGMNFDGIIGLSVGALALVAAAACDLDVILPAEVEDSDIQGIESLALLATSAHGVFECAFSQYVFLSGFVGDEIFHSGSRGQLNSYDQRLPLENHGGYATNTCPGGQFGALYTPMSQARWMADDVLRRAEGVTEADLSGVSEIRALAASLAGYSYVIFGEGFCSGAFDEGPELFQADILALAVTRFTTAIAAAEAAGSTELRNLAYVGRARANLKAGNLPEAASDAREVDAGFVYDVTRSSSDTDRWNPVYHLNAELQEVQGHPNFWNLDWQGVPDPRPKVNVTGGASRMGAVVPEVLMQKYTSVADNIALARHTEALLIIAEAEGGQSAVDQINTLHAAAGLPPFASSDPTEIMEHVWQERARELYLEGHRFGDLRRLPQILGVRGFDEGPHLFIVGRFYADLTCFPLPEVERENNPSIPYP